MSSRCILSSNSDCESHTRLSSWLAPPAKDATTFTRQRTISVSLLPKEAVLWDCSQWLVMVPLTFLKSTILYMRAKLKSQRANSALRNLRIRQVMFSTPTISQSLKASLKKIAPLHCTSCHTMSVEEMPSEGFVHCHHAWKTFPVLFHLDWGHMLRTGNHWLHLKDLGNKNLTCNNLSIALILWHFIKMLAMKSEPIFWLSRNHKI